MEQEKKNDKLLEVRDLKVSFFTPAGEVKAVNGISYDVNYDEVMGVVGESGSGKTTIGRAVIRVNPCSAGEILYKGVKFPVRFRIPWTGGYPKHSDGIPGSGRIVK